MAAGMLLNWSGRDLVVPGKPYPDWAVAPNFERFSGLAGVRSDPTVQNPASPGSPSLDHPAGADPSDTLGTGADFGFDQVGHYPRPGQINQPKGQVYTPGPLGGVVGVVGGQPLPVETCILRSAHTAETGGQAGGYTPSKWPTIQWRLGVGQANQGVAQTVALSEITNNPPQPGDLTSILAGLG